MVKLSNDEITKMRIKRIEKEIRDTPYHKGTEHHIGRLRAKLSKLKSEEQNKGSKKSGGGGLRLGRASGSERGYAVKQQGDATIVLVGAPSVGKSTLINKLTNAKSKIAPYSFTTVSVIPGMMDYKNAKIQILDVPGLIKGAEEGRGRGKEVLSVIRNCDLLIIMCDVGKEKNLDKIVKTLERNGIRINKEKPKINISKKVRGGIQIYSNVKQKINKETIKSVAKEFGFVNGEITLKQQITIDGLIDSFSKNRVYVKAICAVNKIDTGRVEKRKQNTTCNDMCYISAESGEGLNELKESLWNNLGFITIYLVRRDEKPSNKHPLIVKRHEKLIEVGSRLGSEFMENIKRAKIWGSGAKFAGQEVPLSTEVKNRMQVRFV